jgi:DNA processing protein
MAPGDPDARRPGLPGPDVRGGGPARAGRPGRSFERMEHAGAVGRPRAAKPAPHVVARRLAAVGARAVGSDDPAYPAALRDLADAPATLYVRGRLPEGRCVAIVGSRAASAYGRARAHELARDLAHVGCVIVSGLALGIDAAAHRGALEADGASVAVLPCGVDDVVPPGHAGLAAALLERGALVSEWPCGPPWGRGAFVSRNRLVAALADAVVVVEAAEGSGALTTARHARRLGRALLGVPGDVERVTTRGVHALLRAGAALCEHAGDVLAALEARDGVPSAARPRGPTAAPDVHRRGPDAGWPAGAGEGARDDAGPPARPATAAAGAPQRVLAALERVPCTVDALALASGLGAEVVWATLLQLQWAGLAAPHPGARWSRT